MMNGGTVMEVDTGLSRLTLSHFIEIEWGREDNAYVQAKTVFRNVFRGYDILPLITRSKTVTEIKQSFFRETIKLMVKPVGLISRKLTAPWILARFKLTGVSQSPIRFRVYSESEATYEKLLSGSIFESKGRGLRLMVIR